MRPLDEAGGAAETPEARFQRARETILSARTGLAEAHGLLKGLLAEVSHAPSRGRIHQMAWTSERALGLHPEFFSEAGQDAYLDREVFRGKRGGTFVEIGAYDGITGSNCLFFELVRGWSGLAIEPSPVFFERARSFRQATCIDVAVAGSEGEAEFFAVNAGFSQMGGLTGSYDPDIRARVEADPRHEGQTVPVRTTTLAALADAHGLEEIDYVSLDVEGGEMAVLEGFPFERIRVVAWTIENNSGGAELPQFMHAKGYRRVEALGVDDVYVIGV